MCGLLNQAIANNFSKNALNYQSIQDPTKPPTKPNTQSSAQQTLTPKYVLTAIFSRSTQNYAVINGSILKVGDSLANIQVVEINESSVVIREQSSSKKDVVLELDGSVSVKKQVSQ